MGSADDDFEATNAPTFTRQDGPRTPNIVVFSKDGRQVYAVPRGATLTLGRSPQCDVPIDDRSVSRRHALVHGTSPLTLEDLGSANGTWFEGRRLTRGQRVRLPPMSHVELGSVVVVVGGDASDAGTRGTDTRGNASPDVGSLSRPPSPATTFASGSGSGAASVMDAVRERIALVAKSTISVIIRGETGAGKEVVARAIYEASPRVDKPFLCINCAALPDALLESELFGFEVGAFSGATRAKPGLLETAHGGTVFFDELGEMSLTTQAKLLRVLETREVARLGGVRTRAIDVRFLAATNRDLHALVADGRFREDLYFRLEGFVIVIPPLRERVAEIPSLVETFLAAACRATERTPPTISDEAMQILRAFPWPGNVRQLKNVVERALLLCSSDVVGPEHVSLEFGVPAGLAEPSAVGERRSAPEPPQEEGPIQGLTSSKRLVASERKTVLEALEKCGGNQSRAARMLGISRGTLLKRLDAFELPRPRMKKER